LGIAIASTGCSRDTPSTEGAFANDLKGAPPAPPRAPVARVGVADDGVKVAPLKAVPISKAGVPDDSVKVAPPPTIGKGGIPDDSIKPRPPGPLPTPPR
jgi:hypothetical protein